MNQRWHHNRDSYRPAGEVIDPRRYEVAEIADDTTAKAFVLQHHYAGTFPAARFRFGLYEQHHFNDVQRVSRTHGTRSSHRSAGRLSEGQAASTGDRDPVLGMRTPDVAAGGRISPRPDEGREGAFTSAPSSGKNSSRPAEDIRADVGLDRRLVGTTVRTVVVVLDKPAAAEVAA